MVEPQKESKIVFLQMKETLNDHRDINLSEIFKEKECIETRIGDFDIDCILDEETQVNIMIERTWEMLGNPVMVPSLGGRKSNNLLWKTYPDIYECSWNFDKGRI
jgi:hypothetical protein